MGGVGCQFWPDVTRRFLENNNLEYIIRSHEVKDNGYEVTHDGKCITVFSAPNYCDTMGNKGAFITLDGADMTPNYTTYEAVPHPNVKPMAYANSLFSLFGYCSFSDQIIVQLITHFIFCSTALILVVSREVKVFLVQLHSGYYLIETSVIMFTQNQSYENDIRLIEVITACNLEIF